MPHPLLGVATIDVPPGEYLESIGEVFATFDERTQDSGNVSYGVHVGGARYFVKTPGTPEDERWLLDHPGRVELLRNAAEVARSCAHPALVPLRNTMESPHGPALVYDWADGELLRAPPHRRDDPTSAFQRFRALAAGELMAALNVVFDVNVALASSGWVANDFYDGSLIYDFDRGEVHVVDLDSYRRGAFDNDMGRMFGSGRFMAPEELELGARIDERTTVFTLGRATAVLLSDGTLERLPFRGSAAQHAVMRRACEPLPELRYASVEAFVEAWRKAS